MRGGTMQEYKKISITKDQSVPIAQKMRAAGVPLAMIHGFIISLLVVLVAITVEFAIGVAPHGTLV